MCLIITLQNSRRALFSVGKTLFQLLLRNSTFSRFYFLALNLTLTPKTPYIETMNVCVFANSVAQTD
jgi:hypothetical protein